MSATPVELVLTTLVWSSVLLTLIVRFYYPRTTFGVVLILGVLFFCVEMVVVEDAARPVVQFGAMAPFVIWLGALFVRDVMNLARGADAQLWERAGMSGMYHVWAGYTVSGAAARKYWLLASVCTLAILLSLTSVFSLMILTGKDYEIRDVNEVLWNFNEEQAPWVVWPNDELRTQTASAAWAAWRPKKGDVGRLVWWHKPTPDAKYVHRIEILEITDDAGAKHYVAIPAIGTSRHYR
jgi:hypothetical protein